MTAPWQADLVRAGLIIADQLNVVPVDPPLGRTRHAYGNGPFAKLRMPALPNEPGIYVWACGDAALYVGQTVGTLRSRLGSNGYATISTYNTFARQAGRSNGGQQTNCRVNALANAHLDAGGELELWYRVTSSAEAKDEEARFMRTHRVPPWNRHDRR